jgi:solute carrier family 25 thiamine pyrophosphate transporter 19
MRQTIVLITKEEGIFALWKGHVPAQILSIIYGTCQVYNFNVSDLINKHVLLTEYKYYVFFIVLYV